MTFQFWQDSKYDSEKFNSDIDFGNIRLTVDYKEDLDNLKLLGEMIEEKNSSAYKQRDMRIYFKQ